MLSYVSDNFEFDILRICITRTGFRFLFLVVYSKVRVVRIQTFGKSVREIDELIVTNYIYDSNCGYEIEETADYTNWLLT